jgi:hypothetical protein
MFKKKQPTLNELESLSDFYVMDLYDMMDDNFEKPVIPNRPIHGLRHDEVSKQDFDSIAQFGKIIKNYQRMKRLEIA